MRTFVALCAILLAVPGVSYASDDLAAAMKRIAELEAANKAKDAEISRLKSKPVAHVAKVAAARKVKVSGVQKDIPEPHPLSVPALMRDGEPALAGFYAGINGGYGGGDVATNEEEYSFRQISGSPTPILVITRSLTQRFGGAVAGGQVGYNFITSSHVLLGGEIDMDWADISNNSNASLQTYPTFATAYGSTTNGNRHGLRWLGTARARLGYQIGSIVPYLTGGLAFGEAAYSFRSASAGFSYTPDYYAFSGALASGASQKTSVGWAVGAGIDYEITKNISATTQYLYTQLSASRVGNNTIGINSIQYQNNRFDEAFRNFNNGRSNQLGFHQVRFGLNYHLHMDEAPPVIAARF